MLVASATADSRYLFNNSKRLRKTLFEELSDYAVIVVDLPPLLETAGERINPISAALACDGVILLCARARTSRHTLARAVEMAQSSGVKFLGTVLNNYGGATVGNDLARSIRRFSRFAPRLAAWLERKVTTSPLLN